MEGFNTDIVIGILQLKKCKLLQMFKQFSNIWFIYCVFGQVFIPTFNRQRLLQWKNVERNKVMKINEHWEELKEESYANIQSEQGILKQQTHSIQTEGHFRDMKVYKGFMLYVIGRSINKYYCFLYREISRKKIAENSLR